MIPNDWTFSDYLFQWILVVLILALCVVQVWKSIRKMAKKKREAKCGDCPLGDTCGKRTDECVKSDGKGSNCCH